MRFQADALVGIALGALRDGIGSAVTTLAYEVSETTTRHFAGRLIAMTRELTGISPMADLTPAGRDPETVMDEIIADVQKIITDAHQTRMKEQAAILGMQISRLVNTLTVSAQMFEQYAALHLMKEPPAIDKATANAKMAAGCRQALHDIAL